MGLQALVRLVFPPQCLNCGAATADDFGLCGACWPDAAFVSGLVCDTCGVPLAGSDEGRAEYCDDCLAIARPWSRGRAALVYKDLGRSFVLALKHGDRLDLVRPMAEWLERAARPIVAPDMLVAPIPLHWSRLLRRRYNQSALLSRAFAARMQLDQCPDLLVRDRRTASQDHRDRDARFANLAGAIRAHPRRVDRIRGRRILLIDDVMTSGATFAAAAEACLAAGATEVCILALARVAKDA
ncbi:double zinc ribbon domain-containing protein [Defluviimonas sp. WL0002]|uniref:Double zinc ribbon domain-containing protein n=1 Tax=Albidovulum marisflavi TaxID=2984159 RepID=A0ABT2Z8N3_9RHOB|nr:double zinc ribbon domain-containing protein [Defluviimonas sp. WL0002]MCV2867382.1 double zinc ribbon domain-containing protein [Defluviimonas sp. WL0002]